MSILFLTFISVGEQPDDWPYAVVTPQTKDGLFLDVTNYRPIFVASVDNKLIE